MSIQVGDFPNMDPHTVRRVLVRARLIAPTIDTLDGEPKQDAISILRAVILEVPETGTRRARSMSRNGTSISFDSSGMFTAEEAADLRGLCGVSVQGGPVGSFPTDRPLKGLWPEEACS